MAKNNKRGLGRGLSALMADVDAAPRATPEGSSSNTSDLVPIDRVYPNADQPRRHFDPDKLQELSDSILAKGIVQPLIVRRKSTDAGDYEIVAGERRWRAAQLAQLHEVPILVRDFDDAEVLEIAIIENIQRADLNPIEEATGYRQLLDKFGHTQDQLASALGKSRSHIANLMRLLHLPDTVQNLVQEGQLSAGHARALITAQDPAALAQQVVDKGLSVRETEKLAKKINAPGETVNKGTGSSQPSDKDADTKALEGDLSAATGMRVIIDHEPGGEAGKMTITYRTLDDLDTLCQRLSATN